MTPPILLCATPEEYAHWAQLRVVPPVIVNPSEQFCVDALAGGVRWCLAERQAGRCCRSTAEFAALQRDADESNRQSEAPPPVRQPYYYVPPRLIATYTYPVTETVHAVSVREERTICGIPLMGFRYLVPHWREQFSPNDRRERVTCRRCRQIAERDEAA